MEKQEAEIQKVKQNFDEEIKNICIEYKDYEQDYLINHGLMKDDTGCYVCDEYSIEKTVDYIITLKELNQIKLYFKDKIQKIEIACGEIQREIDQLKHKNQTEQEYLSQLVKDKKQFEENLKKEKTIDETVINIK
jgi:hypothetical protein